MTESQPPLEPVDEDWERALAVVAHPDDLEFGAAAAVARWTDQGKDVVYCLVTSGEAGIDAMPPEEAGPLREAEQRESARLVGVDAVDFLGLPDGVLEEGLALRKATRARCAGTGPRSFSHQQLPRDVGRRDDAEPGRPHRRRQGDARCRP